MPNRSPIRRVRSALLGGLLPAEPAPEEVGGGAAGVLAARRGSRRDGSGRSVGRRRCHRLPRCAPRRLRHASLRLHTGLADIAHVARWPSGTAQSRAASRPMSSPPPPRPGSDLLMAKVHFRSAMNRVTTSLTRAPNICTPSVIHEMSSPRCTARASEAGPSRARRT